MVGESSLELLANGQTPERYLRNIGTIGLAGQERLLKSRVAVVGAGGLGGLVVELLARMGVGYLKVIDGDVFALHNLNRQVLSTEQNMERNKAQIAAQRVKSINSDVQVEPVAEMLDESNGERLLKGMDVVVDALDTFSSRMLLGRVTAELKIPLVHAAIAGFAGQVMTVMPGDKSFDNLFRSKPPANRGIETTLGNPAGTPALAASLEVQEVVKILTGTGEPIRNKLLYFDTQYNLFEFVKLE
ncbi:MAG: UBA/THIF-type binding protein [Pelosinus sp.]|jgi:molybdopterin/thiamine biosynthesis adenylyltransferase|nr:UBA/THIF-type binding protein [Pelosinus sp.]